MNAPSLALVTSALVAQTPSDSIPSPAVSFDRVVLDAAAIVRQGGVQSVADLLNSRVPGLLVTSGSSLNGSGSRIRFAGPRRVLHDAAPLILIDGVRVDADEDASLVTLGGPGPSRLEDLHVDDIASIEIVRSPAVAMIHGPGAADGVILIETKRGRAGPLHVDGYARGTMQAVPTHWPANYGGVDADHSDPQMRAGGCTLARQAAGVCVQDFVQSFNPLVQRNPFDVAVRRQAGVSAAGGPSWGAFRAAVNVEGDGGVYEPAGLPNPDSYRRWNLAGSGELRLLPQLDAGFTISRLSSDLDLPTYSPVQSALLGPSDSAGFTWDPLFDIARTRSEAVERTSGAAHVQGRPLPWLAVSGRVGLDWVDQGDRILDPGVYRLEGRREIRHRTVRFEAAANAPRSGVWRSRTTVGVERFARRLEAAVREGPDTDPFCGGLCASTSLTTEARWLGVYITEEAALRERLFITAALRRDATQGFGSEIHPGVAVAWVARPDRPGAVNRVRLRAAYGSAGHPLPLEAVAFVVGPPQLPAPRARPDKVRSLEAGADARLFRGLVDAQVTFYDMRSDAAVLLPGSAYSRAAGISNRGVVATVGATVIEREALGWRVQLALWGNRNRLQSLATPPFLVRNQIVRVGQPAGWYAADRIATYTDANNDGIIVPSEIVLDPLGTGGGTPYPTQGASLISTWHVARRWRLSALLDYRAGQTLFNQIAWLRCRRVAAVCRESNDPATPLRAQAVAAAATVGVPVEYFEDADYLKLRELQLTFDIPPAVAAMVRARGAAVTLSGRNLATWTGYSGGDPEAGSYGTTDSGIMPTVADVGAIPVPRSWALQVRFSY